MTDFDDTKPDVAALIPTQQPARGLPGEDLPPRTAAGETASPDPRDFVGEMSEVLHKAMASGGYVPSLLAREIEQDLLANDPELLEGWVRVKRVHFIHREINDIDRSIRSYTRANRDRREFGEALSAPEGEEREARLRDFLAVRYTVADGSRQPLGKMRAPDLDFVADDYGRRARDNALMEAVMRALKKKIGSDTVEDHYTNDELAAMFDGLDAS